jgi:hypothetical protein
MKSYPCTICEEYSKLFRRLVWITGPRPIAPSCPIDTILDRGGLKESGST